MKSSTFL